MGTLISYKNSGALAEAVASSVTPALPASIVAGNMLLVVAASITGAVAHSYPAGWTKIDEIVEDVNRISWGYRIADGADTAPLIDSTDGAVTLAKIYQFEGTHPTTPIVGTATEDSGVADPHTVAQITTAENNSWALYIDVALTTGNLVTPSGYTSLSSEADTSDSILFSIGYKLMPAAAATGAISTTTSAAVSSWVMWLQELARDDSPLALQFTGDAGVVVGGAATVTFVASTQAVGSPSLGSLTVDGDGSQSTLISGGGTLPHLQSAGTLHSAPNEVSLSSLATAGQSYTGALISGGGTLPLISSAGTVMVAGLGSGSPRLGALTTEGAGYSSVVVSGGGTLPALRGSGSILVGAGASGGVSLSALLTEGSSWSSITIGGAGVLPGLVGSGTIIIGDASSRLWAVMNTGNGAVTEYEDWAFDSVVVFNGDMLLAGAAGIAVVGGAADASADIAAYITTGKTDHGTDASKRATDAYVALKTAGTMELTVTGKLKGREASYTYDVPYGTDEEEAQKVDLGRGFESRYFQYTLANRDGEHFAIDALAVLAQVTGRRG